MGPTDLPQELRHSTSGVGVFPDKGSTSSTTHCSNGSSHVNQPYSTKTPSLPLLVQAHDMGLSVKNTSSNSPLHSKTVSNPPWDVVAAGSSSMVPHHPGSMDPPPRPSHPPPTSQDPPRNHGPWSCEELEAANAQVRTSRGSCHKLIREWAGGATQGNQVFYPCKRRAATGRLPWEFEHSCQGGGRTAARRCTRYANPRHRYTIFKSPVAGLSTTIIGGWVYSLIITSSLLSVVCPNWHPSIHRDLSITWPDHQFPR